MVVDVSDQNFDNEVIKSTLLVLVDLWAPWCSPCRMVAPVIEKLAEKYSGKVKFCRVNVDDNSQTVPLVLRFLQYWDYYVTHATTLKDLVKLNQRTAFDLILMNIAIFCQHEFWLAEYTVYLQQKIPMICYTAELLISDFNQALLADNRNTIHDGWVLHSELFQFLQQYNNFSHNG